MQRGVLLLAAFALAACSGGGGAPAPAVGGQPQVEGLAQQSLVVQYDHNGDGEPDWLTVDTSESPFTIVEVLEGVPNAQPFDATAVAAGTPIDPEISQALADHIANSLNVVERTELDVRDAAGEPVRVVVFE